MRTLFIILIFLALGAFFIISNHNLHIGAKAEFEKFSGLYYSWLSGLFDNAKDITGYVIKSDWLPKTLNSTKLNFVK